MVDGISLILQDTIIVWMTVTVENFRAVEVVPVSFLVMMDEVAEDTAVVAVVGGSGDEEAIDPTVVDMDADVFDCSVLAATQYTHAKLQLSIYRLFLVTEGYLSSMSLWRGQSLPFYVLFCFLSPTLSSGHAKRLKYETVFTGISNEIDDCDRRIPSCSYV